MTHPPAGPSSPPSSPGPGRLSAWLDRIRTARTLRAAAAQQAGTRSRHVQPLTVEQRKDRYRRQTGTKELTPRQRRRVAHKANRAAVGAA